MEKKKWPWKRKSSDKSPGESESSESISSPSEKYSDEPDASKESPSHSTQSPEVTSKAAITDDEIKESVKILTEKLSAALFNVSAKEDLVKQHAKVAEEAVAGWERAENEVTVLKQQLDAAVQQNLNLEVRVSHLDGALKECVRQLRQARDELEQRISDAVADKAREWDSTKAELENQILNLKTQTEAGKIDHSASSVDPDTLLLLKTLERENLSLKNELLSQSKELEILAIERDLSTQAAENASKLQLEGIKKVAKLEAECRRLQAMARKSSPVNDQKSVTASSFCVESTTDSQSDSGERLNTVETDLCKTFNGETHRQHLSCSDSWASALIAELDQFKNEKFSSKIVATSSIDMDMMDDFLEMERLAALPETKPNTPFVESEAASGESSSIENSLREELETMTHRVAELEEKMQAVEAEKSELMNALDESQESLRKSQTCLEETEIRLQELERELNSANEAKELLEFQLIGMEVETRTMSSNLDSLKAEIEKERTSSAEFAAKCQQLENVLASNIQQSELQESTKTNGELKIKQEDLAVAADKLAECQKTIASLGRQLESLATLEDFLIDTANIPGFSRGPLGSGTGEMWRLHSNETFMPKSGSDPSKILGENTCLVNGSNVDSPPSSSSSASSANHLKSRNGFGKFFSRSKSVTELENHQAKQLQE